LTQQLLEEEVKQLKDQLEKDYYADYYAEKTVDLAQNLEVYCV
jgi:hypothetical protein